MFENLEYFVNVSSPYSLVTSCTNVENKKYKRGHVIKFICYIYKKYINILNCKTIMLNLFIL